MESIKPNIPLIRFPEFHETWKEKRIDSILKIGSGKDYKHLKMGDIPVYGTGGYMLSVNDFLYDGESVCIGRKGTIDKPIFLTNKFWTVDTLFYTHSFNNSIPFFVFLLFQRINWKKHNEASGVPSLSKTTIEKIKITVPKIEEQQKISSFLVSVDDKIDQLTRKKELLERYKKGVIQKIFKKEIRFNDNDGNVFSDWEKKELGDVLSFISTNSLSRDMLNDEDGEVRNIHYGDIHTKFKSNFIVQEEQVPYINKNVDISM